MARLSMRGTRARGRGTFWKGVATGIVIGAGATYLFDPMGGRRRRALLRDKALRAAHEAGEGAGRRKRDLASRSRGFFARLRGRGRRQPADHRLEERVRAELRQFASYPAVIRVTADEGCVELSGPILESEYAPVMAAVRAIPGVLAIDDDLDRRADAAGMPSFEGAR